MNKLKVFPLIILMLIMNFCFSSCGWAYQYEQTGQGSGIIINNQNIKISKQNLEIICDDKFVMYGSVFSVQNILDFSQVAQFSFLLPFGKEHQDEYVKIDGEQVAIQRNYVASNYYAGKNNNVNLENYKNLMESNQIRKDVLGDAGSYYGYKFSKNIEDMALDITKEYFVIRHAINGEGENFIFSKYDDLLIMENDVDIECVPFKIPDIYECLFETFDDGQEFYRERFNEAMNYLEGDLCFNFHDYFKTYMNKFNDESEGSMLLASFKISFNPNETKHVEVVFWNEPGGVYRENESLECNYFLSPSEYWGGWG